jgi:hypothetical protein
MIPTDENTRKSDGSNNGGHAGVAQPKPEIPDVVPHKPEIDHTDTDGVDRKEFEPGTIYMGSNEGGKKSDDPQNASGGRDQTKPGQAPSQPTPDDASKDLGQRQGGGSNQQKQQQSSTPARS